MSLVQLNIPMMEDLYCVLIENHNRGSTLEYKPYPRANAPAHISKLQASDWPHCFRGTYEEAEAICKGVSPIYNPTIIRESKMIYMLLKP